MTKKRAIRDRSRSRKRRIRELQEEGRTDKNEGDKEDEMEDMKTR